MELFREVENKGIPCHLFGYILDAEEKTNFYDRMDLYLSALGDGIAEVEIPVSSMHYRSETIVQDGVFSALCSAAMETAVRTKNQLGRLLSLQIQYLQTAEKGDVLRAEATVLGQKEEIVFCAVKLYNQREQLLATGQGTYQIQESDFVQYYAARLKEEQKKMHLI